MALLLSWSWGDAAVVESMLRSTSLILLPTKVSDLALWHIAGNDIDLAYNRRGAVWRMRSARRSASWRSSAHRRAWASWAWTPSTNVAPLIVCLP